MKKIILLLVTVICGINLFAQSNTYRGGLVLYEPTRSEMPRYQKTNELEDGTFRAIVEYRNSNTFTTNKYSLSVIVVDDRVVQINFDNGGFINYNSHNIHSYSGGQLSFSRDYSGNIVSASTTVVVKDSYTSSVTYKIYIQ